MKKPPATLCRKCKIPIDKSPQRALIDGYCKDCCDPTYWAIGMRDIRNIEAKQRALMTQGAKTS